ncbi:beta-arabinofuranosyltransferase RAY1 [Elaeis guineensis]|uniref:Beta-arabinofuranosyltransferase RAY1 isoform X1 n=1 Tax=Elaeis guineensis var. tenera TaxID=51953 RepID=A0A6J0PF02_ELAGV|nr:beta-arabinofuranosyltransferase RAY1 isoform X1 [Elaeis guineensis]
MGVGGKGRIGVTNGSLPRYSTSSRLRRNKLLGMPVLLASFGWICGFFLITASFYFLLDQQQHQQQPLYNDDGCFPSITIYAAPRPFSSGKLDLIRARQELAVRSWLALSLDVHVVLFGQHPSIVAFAGTLGPRVTVESDIDFTFQGTPFFHSMVARSQASRSDISMIIDSETVLLPDILTTLHHAYKLNRDWFLFSKSLDISHFSFQLVDNGKHWLREDGKKIEFKKLQECLVQKQWQSERFLMAWNTGKLPLHAGILPPFLYGKGLHNEWLVNEVLSSDLRLVFDASEVVSSFYPETLGQWSHKYLPHADSDAERNWEFEGNHHLAALYGTLFLRQNNTPSNLIKLVKCFGQYYFVNQAKKTVYSLQGPNRHASYSLEPVPIQEQETLQLSTRFLHSWKEKKRKTCLEDINSLDKECKYSFMTSYKVSFEVLVPLSVTFSLESLLQMIADKDKSIVLAVAGDSYRDMLMSWVCRLRLLAVHNFIVCALDSEIYHFSVLQGLPVFKDPLAPSNISFNNCHFGTECFQRVTKVKSRIVLQILKLGYNVLMSDVDVYWFDNPLPFLLSFGPASLVAQSDEYNETGPINLPRRLNSGFYFARSDSTTIAAMEMVVRHASSSDLSEQPSFYDVLCGEGGVNRVGDDRCREPSTNLTVFFLDRNFFPNGAYKGLWEKPDVRSACMKLGCLILHNNWISGRKKKLERQVLSGLWDYDPSSRLCLHSWHRTKFMTNF